MTIHQLCPEGPRAGGRRGGRTFWRILSASADPGRVAFVNVVSLGWVGTRADPAEPLARFYADVLGLPLIVHEPDFWVFELPDGYHVEVFGPGYPGREHFTTGPVVGFAVADFAGAVDELRDHGIELLAGAGPTWQHFRGPDGNIYELVAAEPT